MLGVVTEKFQALFHSLGKKKKLTEENLSEAIREVRLALLDADVNYSIASKFIKRVKEKVLGEEVVKSVTPQQQFTKIIHDELISLMGEEEASLELKQTPSVIMLCGLQGSGKTTHSAKLAAYLQKKGIAKKPLLAACDLQRPAAIEQLKQLGEKIDIPVFSIDKEKKGVKVAKEALKKAKKEGFDLLIVDTAGRLQIDADLMKELKELKSVLNPDEVLFVANAATGQEAPKVAVEFDQQITLTGTILTMLDGSARAGAAISIKEVTGKPLKFEGIGEKVTDLQPFNPRSMADRILGMGDVINLVRLAEDSVDKEEQDKLEKKFRQSQFTYQDYLKQMGMIKKMGPMQGLLKMMPGMGSMPKLDHSEKEFAKMEAMILSMTESERIEKVELVPSRRRRIAKGSGVKIDDVNRMVKGFKQVKKMAKDMPRFKKKMMQSGMFQ